jgi:hypothetical protein
MKVEIELNDLNSLKTKLDRSEKTIKDLEKQIKDLDPEALKSQAVELSKTMFEKYMTAVFQQLGFDNKDDMYDAYSIDWAPDLKLHLGKNWYESQELKVELAAKISPEWKQAFLRMGVQIKKPLA